MKRGVVLVAGMLMALPLAGRASAKKLDEFQRKELQELRQERRDTKAELQNEEREEQQDNFERTRARDQQRHHSGDLDDDDDLDFGGDD
jgi:hypothetical protein